MRTLYLDTAMGLAGDMFSAALLQLFKDDKREELLLNLNQMGLDGVETYLVPKEMSGVLGCQLKVEIHGEEEHEHQAHGHHHGRSLSEVLTIIDALNVPNTVKEKAKEMYQLIAKAESKAHGKEVAEIHFHEVGMLDAIFDVTAACYLMEKLSVDEVVATPLCVGGGTVHCAHGILSVPAPATKNIVEDAGISYEMADESFGELCTPTGAAIYATFVNRILTRDTYGKVMESLFIKDEWKMSEDSGTKKAKKGFGMGHKEFEEPNCVKAYLVEG